MEAIIVEDLHKTFRLSHERIGSLKALALSFRRATYEDIHALKGVSFSVEPGETVAIVGRNGSGKSTLLGIMSRVYRPTSGKVVMNGRVSGLLELGAGFHPDLTGIENIYLDGSILGLSRREIRKRFDAIVSFAEMEQFIDAPLRMYSSGMVMRLGFSLAVQVDPDILLVDEVLAVGDESFQQKCYEKVREFQRLGKTILFVSHDLKVVRDVATRAIWLDSGSIQRDGDVESVLEAYVESTRSGAPDAK
ncbi:MAG TPA: ABC transporter ATP-binding protein [Armatimonadota bacterium]|nr:ABC transporter ATP-binding protein [Armatimonadota bacterium]